MNMKKPFVRLAIGQFALAAGARVEGQWESWVKEWLEDRLVRYQRDDDVREDSGQQDGKFWPCLPKKRDSVLRDGWVHDGGAAGRML